MNPQNEGHPGANFYYGVAPPVQQQTYYPVPVSSMNPQDARHPGNDPYSGVTPQVQSQTYYPAPVSSTNPQDERHPGNNLYPGVTPPVQPQTYYLAPVSSTNPQDERHPGNNLYPGVTPPVQPQTYYPAPAQPNTNSYYTSSSYPAVQPSAPITAPGYKGCNPIDYSKTPAVPNGTQNMPPSSEGSTSLAKEKPNQEAAPPPAYSAEGKANIEPEVKAIVLQQPTSHVPQILYCPNCKGNSQSTVTYHTSTSTYVASGICFFFGCWPCCIFPFISDSFQRAEHFCPTCHYGLGAHEPF